MWLVAHRRYWTADRLARRNMPHPSKCPLCNQEEETIDHLLTSCVFARRFWFLLLQRADLAALAPQPRDLVFGDWWSRADSLVDSALKDGLNSLIILGAWMLWRHRNECVFNGASPSLPAVLSLAENEAWLWSMAGANGLSQLASPQPL